MEEVSVAVKSVWWPNVNVFDSVERFNSYLSL